MKASVLFGAGWENDSVEVLWRDAGRVFCRLCRNDTECERHAFIPIPAGVEHPTLESINRLTREHELKNYLDTTWALRPPELVRERGQRCLWSITQEASRSIASSGSRWKSDSSFDSPWRCLAQLVSYTDRGLIHKDRRT